MFEDEYLYGREDEKEMTINATLNTITKIRMVEVNMKMWRRNQPTVFEPPTACVVNCPTLVLQADQMKIIYEISNQSWYDPVYFGKSSHKDLDKDFQEEARFVCDFGQKEEAFHLVHMRGNVSW